MTENRKSMISGEKVKGFMPSNSVLLLFLVICTIGIIYSGQTFNYIFGQVIQRFFRNIVLVLSLLVPVWCGMGLNFSIVVGAMSAQAGLIVALNFGIPSMGGILTAMAAGMLLSSGLGFLTGKLFNRTKGQEMITGMILGYFANGLYQLIFMYLCGSVIPMKNEAIMLTGIGVNGIITFDGTYAGVLDNLWKLPADKAIVVMICLVILWRGLKIALEKKHGVPVRKKEWIILAVMAVVAIGVFLLGMLSEDVKFIAQFNQIPMVTALIAVVICIFINFLATTKLGSDIRAVGQSMPIARAAGINVNKIRVISIMISTVIASIGQVIYLQSLGTMSTYSAADQIGTFSVAALLVGGASIKKANIRQAIVGTLLFHLMFILAPIAGKNIFGEAQIGEYFRVFVSYAVIAVALALHAWSTLVTEKRKKKQGPGISLAAGR